MHKRIRLGLCYACMYYLLDAALKASSGSVDWLGVLATFWFSIWYSRSCQKLRNGAIPVPGPIKTIGVLGSSGIWKLRALHKSSRQNHPTVIYYVHVCVCVHSCMCCVVFARVRVCVCACVCIDNMWQAQLTFWPNKEQLFQSVCYSAKLSTHRDALILYHH